MCEKPLYYTHLMQSPDLYDAHTRGASDDVQGAGHAFESER